MSVHQFSGNGRAVKNGDEYFSEVKSRISVRDVLHSEGIELGRDDRCICPFHEGDNGGNPDGFSLNPDGEHMRCFVCGWRGDVIDFYGKIRGIPSQLDAARELDERFGRRPVARKPKADRSHDYQDEYGNVVYRTVRKDDRWFQERYDRETHRFVRGKGCMQGVKLYPYRLPEVLLRLEENPEEIVYIAEGEKDVDTLWRLGRAATCNPMGAGKWRDEFSKWFAGRKVVVFWDNDQVGREHAQKVAGSLHAVGCVIRVLGMPGGHHDVSDFVAAGGTWKELSVAIKATDNWIKATEGSKENGEYRKLSDEEVGLGRYNERSIKNVRWIVPGFVQVGGMTIISGDGGVGKSQIAAAISASLTKGSCLPGCAPPPKSGTVIMMTAEDGDEDTVVPRLMAAGADISKIRPVEANVTRMVNGVRKIYPKSFQDLDWWEDLIRRCGDLRLVIADTIPSYLGRGVNDNVNIEVRQILEPFVNLLGKAGAGFLGICHNNKSNDSVNPVHKISGSMAYGNYARVVFCAYEDPESPGRYYMLNHKGNNLPGDKKIARAYTIETKVIINEETRELIETSVVRFEKDPVPVTFGQIKAAATRISKRGPEATRASDLAVRLRTYLEENPGPRRVGEIMGHFGDLGLVGHLNDSGFWSNGKLLYTARKLVQEIVETEEPRLRGGKPVTFWEIRKDAAGASYGKLQSKGQSSVEIDPSLEDFSWS